MHAAEKLICIGVWCTCHTYEHTYIHTYIHIQILVKSFEKNGGIFLAPMHHQYTQDIHTYIHISTRLNECVSLIRERRHVSRAESLAVRLEGGGVLAQVLVADRHQRHHRPLLIGHTHCDLHTYIHTYHTIHNWNFCQLFYIDNTCIYACTIKVKSSGVDDLIGMHVLYVCMYACMYCI